MKNGDVQEMINSVGAMGELAHFLYKSMIDSGADGTEAAIVVACWINVYWRELMERNRHEQDD